MIPPYPQGNHLVQLLFSTIYITSFTILSSGAMTKVFELNDEYLQNSFLLPT